MVPRGDSDICPDKLISGVSPSARSLNDHVLEYIQNIWVGQW